MKVSIPFRADTGFEHRIWFKKMTWIECVSIPFRADTGFELVGGRVVWANPDKFQSLSGLTLGLNTTTHTALLTPERFNPFQG